eukprot:TRINITY_DN3353_c0_g4_i2.p1 TRINITY_DN3353_c0_g4~~TRINITY_DN3353_c0_g4_i2.p1  ORF type:complete len:766 (+),score=175.78 TRINITY_DN3353_c0_g4_i2:792-3089(+)
MKDINTRLERAHDDEDDEDEFEDEEEEEEEEESSDEETESDSESDSDDSDDEEEDGRRGFGEVGEISDFVGKLRGGQQVSQMEVNNSIRALQTLPDDVDFLIAIRNFDKAVSLIEAGAQMASRLGRQGKAARREIEMRSQRLECILVRELRSPNISKEEGNLVISFLTRLGLLEKARSVFLETRGKFLRNELLRLKFDGNTITYIRQLSRTTFDHIKTSCDLFRYFFPDPSLSSAYVVWATEMLAIFAKHFCTRVFYSCTLTDFQQVSECFELVHSYSRTLQQFGLSLEFFFSPICTANLATWLEDYFQIMRSNLNSLTSIAGANPRGSGENEAPPHFSTSPNDVLCDSTDWELVSKGDTTGAASRGGGGSTNRTAENWVGRYNVNPVVADRSTIATVDGSKDNPADLASKGSAASPDSDVLDRNSSQFVSPPISPRGGGGVDAAYAVGDPFSYYQSRQQQPSSRDSSVMSDSKRGAYLKLTVSAHVLNVTLHAYVVDAVRMINNPRVLLLLLTPVTGMLTRYVTLLLEKLRCHYDSMSLTQVHSIIANAEYFVNDFLNRAIVAFENKVEAIRSIGELRRSTDTTYAAMRMFYCEMATKLIMTDILGWKEDMTSVYSTVPETHSSNVRPTARFEKCYEVLAERTKLLRARLGRTCSREFVCDLIDTLVAKITVSSPFGDGHGKKWSVRALQQLAFDWMFFRTFCAKRLSRKSKKALQQYMDTAVLSFCKSNNANPTTLLKSDKWYKTTSEQVLGSRKNLATLATQ